MNIGNTIKNLVANTISYSINDEGHAQLKNTKYYNIAYDTCNMIQVPINESIWLSAYDGVCDNI